MTDDRMPLAELLQEAGDAISSALLLEKRVADPDGDRRGGANRRRPAQLTHGYRERTFDTRLGSLNLKIPKLRQGSYFPPFLEARKTTEKALVAVIQEAWIGRVSTRRVDEHHASPSAQQPRAIPD